MGNGGRIAAGRDKMHGMLEPVTTIKQLVDGAATFVCLLFRRHRVLAAENLFLRKQLAFYQERGTRPRRLDPAARIVLVLLSKLFDWRHSLVIVQPAMLLRWHRQGFRLLWRWKSKPGRPPIPRELQMLIRRMARENPTCGEERIANELLLKLGLRISPRTVRKYMPKQPPGRPRGDQRWATFLRNRAQAIVACDFCIAVTATFRMLYILVVIEHGTRRILHCNVTAHPTAGWTRQQLREALPSEHEYRFLTHDRDNIFSEDLDASMRRMRLRVVKTGVPVPLQSTSHCTVRGLHVMARPILGGLHHEYGLVPDAA